MAMNIPNAFLLVHVDGHCFCRRCRIERYQMLVEINYTNAELHTMFTHKIVMEEEQKLDSLYETTLEKILYGKFFKDDSMRGSGLKYFKAWAKRHYDHLTPAELDDFVTKVKKASTVFDKWDTIVENLTDNRLTYIDVRRFSVNQFWLARHLSWCLSYNETLRPKSNKGEITYPEDKYQLILRHVMDSGILDDINNDPQTASCIGGRLQNDMVRRANSRYHPY